MRNSSIELDKIAETDVISFFNDTSNLMGQKTIKNLSDTALVYQECNNLTNDVEFWKWLDRNYSKSGIFNNSESMLQYMMQGEEKEKWLERIIQGKGFEWDWMTQQRAKIKNLSKIFDAGNVANRAASDVTEINLFTGKSTEYQMKAYTSNNTPNLKNTPKDMIIITNFEKEEEVLKKGYKNVKSFQNQEKILHRNKKRINQIEDKKAYTSYNIKNVGGVMAKAGLVGCVIGMSVETICSYKQWKAGNISEDEYLKEILKAGGNGGITSAATAGVMIPVSAAITTMGASTLLTVPIAFVIDAGINQIVAPCFGRGKYKEILNTARYYQELENIYIDLIDSMDSAANQYSVFIASIYKQNEVHHHLKEESTRMDKELKELYDSI